MFGKARKALTLQSGGNASIPTIDPSSIVDTSGCMSREGMLQKKNSAGIWKPRYCLFRNSLFLTYKPVKSPNGGMMPGEMKECIDLVDLKGIEEGSTSDSSPDVFEIVLNDNRRFLYRGADYNDWLDVIATRAMWAEGQQGEDDGRGGGDAPEENSGVVLKGLTGDVILAPHVVCDSNGLPVMEGLLKKKNREGVWKDRYGVFTPDHRFVTYKPRSNGKPSTEVKENINLSTVAKVYLGSPEDPSADCIAVVLRNGQSHLFASSRLREWQDALNVRCHWVQEKFGSGATVAVANEGRVVDETGCTMLEGLLNRKNSAGVWKGRYCGFMRQYFITYKLSAAGSTKASNEVKERLDIRSIASLTYGQHEEGNDVMVMTMVSGDVHLYRGATAEDWYNALLERREWAISNLGEYTTNGKKKSSSTSNGNDAFAGDELSRTFVKSFTDKDGLPLLEGIILKLNREGVWKARYTQFTSTHLQTFKPKPNGKPSSERKELLELKDLEKAVAINEEGSSGNKSVSGQFVIEMRNGDSLRFRSSQRDEWISVINQRAAAMEAAYRRGLETQGISDRVHIFGTLLKKSHNKYQGFQERFVRIEGNLLRYYRKEGETEVLGSMDITTAEFVRPFDHSDECVTFELKSADRVFIFQASSPKEMRHWLSTLNQLRGVTAAAIEAEARARVVADTPIRIRWFDEEGLQVFLERVREDFEEMYPTPPATTTLPVTPGNDAENDDEHEEEVVSTPQSTGFTVKQHIEYATELGLYLQDFVAECQRTEFRPARHDVLAVMMTEVNAVLTARLAAVLPTSTDWSKLTPLINAASLGDLHSLIDFLTRYQKILRGIRCVVMSSTRKASPPPGITPSSLPEYLSPKACPVFESLPPLCHLYVYGGTPGAKRGAAEHLFNHCTLVWEAFVRNPEEMISEDGNGQFYTSAPIDMWEVINSHLALAMKTRSPILHVMVAEKVVASLTELFTRIMDFIKSPLPSEPEGLKDIELEVLCALANDCALHFEEGYGLIEQFTIAEVQSRIDAIFTPLMDTIYSCGLSALKRLSGLVMRDVSELLDELFTPKWLDGNQMHVATATIGDYLRDINRFLHRFWTSEAQYKFCDAMLEEVAIQYVRALLFPKNRQPITHTTTVMEDEPVSGGMFSSWFQKTKQVARTITTTLPNHVVVDGESLGRLAQDVNILAGFFATRPEADAGRSADCLSIINEVSLLMILDIGGLAQHVARCITNFPSSSSAVYEVASTVMKMRYEEFGKPELDFFTHMVQPVMDSAVEDAREKAKNGVAEGRLGQLYEEVVPRGENSSVSLTLAQRMKLMRSLPIFTRQRVTVAEEEDADAVADEEECTAATVAGAAAVGVTAKATELLDSVIDALDEVDAAEQDAAEAELIAREAAIKQAEEYRRRLAELNYEGYLEKRSPAHNLWQRRFFKVQTRETFDEQTPFAHTFMWFKKEGGPVTKSLDISAIDSLALLHSDRPLAYLPAPVHQVRVSAALTPDEARLAEIVKPQERSDDIARSALTMTAGEFYVFSVRQTDGKEHLLRGAKIDRVLQWLNVISTAAEMSYDPISRIWSREARVRQQQAIEQAAARATLTAITEREECAAEESAKIAAFANSEAARLRALAESEVKRQRIAAEEAAREQDDETARFLAAAESQASRLRARATEETPRVLSEQDDETARFLAAAESQASRLRARANVAPPVEEEPVDSDSDYDAPDVNDSDAEIEAANSSDEEGNFVAGSSDEEEDGVSPANETYDDDTSDGGAGSDSSPANSPDSSPANSDNEEEASEPSPRPLAVRLSRSLPSVDASITDDAAELQSPTNVSPRVVSTSKFPHRRRASFIGNRVSP